MLSAARLPQVRAEASIQFNSKTLIIPQGAILLWSWRAHKKYIKLASRYKPVENEVKFGLSEPYSAN